MNIKHSVESGGKWTYISYDISVSYIALGNKETEIAYYVNRFSRIALKTGSDFILVAIM
jgi:hypothetical protein